jgi:hypothetical protein
MSSISNYILTGDLPGTNTFVQNEITVTKMYWLLGCKPKLSTSNKLLKYKIILRKNTALVYGFYFQCRNSRTFPTESLAHDSGRTLVRAEYGYRKGSPNTNNCRKNPLLLLSIQCSPQRRSKRPGSEPHGATRQQAIAKTPAK